MAAGEVAGPDGSPTVPAASVAQEESHVTVAIRLRPPLENQDEETKEMYRASPSTITIRDPLSKGKNEHMFTFNRILLPEHGQEAVFDAVAKPLIDQVLNGFNACCFAYGQTGSGKTHSVFGEPYTSERGMLPRAVEYLFQMIESQADFKEVGMVVSFVEIYLNQVRDLGRFYANQFGMDRREPADTSSSLAQQAAGGTAARRVSDRRTSGSGPDLGGRKSSVGNGPLSPRRQSSATSDVVDPYISQDLAIHESPAGHVYVEDLSLIPVTSIQDVLDIAYLGMSMRATYETKLNLTSSRSHAIFTISIVQKSKRSAKSGVVGSMMNFVDLAGSERLARSQSEGRRFQEAVVINSSLSALGKVVLALADGGARHVPYRDSKLTRILQNSLGGNSYTTLLTTIDPSASNYEESMNSLLFADRCKNVSTRPVQNAIDQEQENNEKLIHRLMTEVAQLRNQVETAHFEAGREEGPPLAGEEQELDETQLDLVQLLGEQPSLAISEGQLPEGAPAPAQAIGWAQRLFATPALASVRGAARSRPLSGAGGKLNRIELVKLEERGTLQLKAEKAKRKDVEREAEHMKDILWKARREHAAWDERVRREMAENRRQIKELEIEIQKHRCKLSSLKRTVGAAQANEHRMLKSNAAEIRRSREALVGQVSADLQLGSLNSAADAFDRECVDALTRKEEIHNGICEGIESGHGSDVDALARQNQQFLTEREAKAKRTIEEIERCVVEGQRQRRRLHGDLIDVHDLAVQLGRVIDKLVAGMPNEMWTGIKPPPLPEEDLRARLAAGDLLPDRLLEKLQKDMSEVRRQVTRSCQILRLPLADAPGGGSATAGGGDSDFARDFCSGAVGPCKLQESLQYLSSRQLKAACLSLRSRARMGAREMEAERTRLCEEVASEFDGHGSLDAVRSLEAEIEGYRFRLQHEQDKCHHARTALQSCERSSAITRPASAARPVSAARPASAGPAGVTARRRL